MASESKDCKTDNGREDALMKNNAHRLISVEHGITPGTVKSLRRLLTYSSCGPFSVQCGANCDIRR